MKYKNPPIKEAVFDIRINRLKNDKLNVIEKLHESITDFPIKQKIVTFAGKIEFKSNKPLQSSTHGQDIDGFVFLSEDKNKQVQFRLDGYTYNILNTYDSWEVHFDEFWNFWELYQKELKPDEIIRIATRFINRIKLPSSIDFDDYITNMPPIPSCLPQKFSAFFTQTKTPIPVQNKEVIINETIETPENDLFFILDIDVYELGEEIIKNDLVDKFTELRKIKNEVFECCITDKTRELFR